MFNDNTPITEFRGPFGVPIQIGASLFLLLAFYLYSGAGDILWSLIFVTLLIFAILLHELGHAWASLVQNVPVRRIMIYGGGGFCERSRSATAFEQELIVAMGPIVNLTLWAVFSLASNGMWDWIISDASGYQNPDALFNSPRAQIAEIMGLFAYINGFLAIFNLLPVQPLDGGKLLHLILLRLCEPGMAMVVTGAVGLALAVLWIPAMVVAFGLGWWLLFFIPSIPLHWNMVRGRLA